MAAKRKRRVEQAEIVKGFAARLREARRSRGLTQADLAARAKVTPSYVGRLEAAAVAPGIDLLDRLARALGVVAADLLPSGDPPDPAGLLREQAQALFGTLLSSADRETLLMLNPLLARLLEAPNRRR